jgi:hydrogenase expression/formation protein HypE
LYWFGISVMDKNESHPKIGKINSDIFEKFLLRRLGHKNESVIVPPLAGVDAGVIDIGNDRVLIVAEDPIFTIPGLPLDMFGWFTVHIGASDVAVMGVEPRYMTYTLLMPPEMPEDDFRAIVDSIHETAKELKMAIVGGHTGYYPGFTTPTIGGITVFAVAGKDDYVTPSGACPGDEVILTKGPAIETAALLSVVREKELLKDYPPDLVNKAKSLSKKMTVVMDALTAMGAGGVTAMHDATEGGVLGGLFEMANASQVGMAIDESQMVYPDEVKMVCEAFSLDPLTVIAEGSLLIASKAECSQEIIRKLEKAGIRASVIGKVKENQEEKAIKRRDGTKMPLSIPEQDPFWPAFFAGLEKVKA